MTLTRFALTIGLVLGVVAAFGGFGKLVIVLLFAMVGLIVGLALDGKIDLPSLLGRSRGQ